MKKSIQTCICFIKKETVLCIAAFLALCSAFFVPPSLHYLEYLDLRVLSLLFCLMLVVAGLQSIGVFQMLGTTLLSGTKNTRQLVLLLTGLCFFSSMLITNDVSLITFVPFAIMILHMADQDRLLIPVIVLQTIAANLGSMFTPVGNPQNLYLYSAFSIPIADFLLAMLPLTLLSLVLLAAAVFLLPNEELSLQTLSISQVQISGKKLSVYLILFLICLACVIHLITFPWMILIVTICIFFVDRSLFKDADYFLLLTFVCFFLFIGNMERIPAIATLLRDLIRHRELFLGILASQCISNVPASILLSGFTDQAIPLLYGVNIGGLGTLIASLASLISYRYYVNLKDAKKGKYFWTFTFYNLVFLLLIGFAGYLLLKIQ
ncbi:SLC13 family permease [Faecalicatena contorta]|uniref:SLC13 family permease n=1 Tax=Faecalicatena contorta TaxID=39482 RepID=UPI001F16D1CF|nr:SLC13 family permease [Faecalicatena contorta]MCF2682591.1 citrate transporter [Faecalicatena contorta]